MKLLDFLTWQLTVSLVSLRPGGECGLRTRWLVCFIVGFTLVLRKGLMKGAIEALGEALGLCPQPVLAFLNQHKPH